MQAIEMPARIPRGQGYLRKGMAAAAIVTLFALLDYLIFSVDLKWTFFALAAITLPFLVLLRWPYGALVAIIVASAIPGFTVQIFSFNAKAEDFVAALVALAILAQVALWQRQLRLRGGDWLLLAFVAMNYVGSSINSPQPKATLRWALHFTLAAASYFIVIHMVSNRERLRKALNIFLIVGAAEVIFGILCYASYRVAGTQLGISVFEFLDYSPGVMGSLWEPNIYGSYAAAVALMFLFYRLTAATPRGWYTLGFSLAVLASFLSLARQAWIGFPAGLLFLLWYEASQNKLRMRKLVSSLALILLAVAGLMFVAAQWHGYLHERLHTLAHPTEEYTFNQRLYYDALALQHVSEHPLFGWGSSSFGLFWDWDTADGPAWVGNLEVRILHDTGAIGLAIFLTFLAKLLWEAVKTFKRTENRDDIRNVGALLGGLIVLLIAFQATDATTLAFPWVHLGLLVAATRIALEEKIPVTAGATR